MQSRLYDLRKHVKGMTQQQMADYLNISVKAYRDKENGKNQFTQDEMFAISKLFDLNIDTIFLPRKFHIGTKS
ncbi:helix-turn-helix domain-containing protein [Limosilactobacillus agrestis]|uniref:Helix-turn-helix domain-containing protein n=1 Tax=Limosilactobacillus agrestis TaxID=2759748 RepID=A0ABS8R862_9LACO|nr:helix-turn-helix transcriptional regulator [Limosilactobacillus agrestis]MCD7130587.1 helix-turn-helix domain-containing protein [Limosilactobacillus agrestis]